MDIIEISAVRRRWARTGNEGKGHTYPQLLLPKVETCLLLYENRAIVDDVAMDATHICTH